MKSEEEVDSELIQIFRDRCYESYMKKVIGDLRKEEVLYKEYSVSGWMVFHCKTINEITLVRGSFEDVIAWKWENN